MAAQPETRLMSLDEYLETSFPDGDREFVDGVVVEREMGTPWHSLLQKILIVYLSQFEAALDVEVFPECRTRVSESRCRIPDLAVVLRPYTIDRRLVVEPPFLVVEVMSPDDRISAMLARFKDYPAFGVAHIVMMDPETDQTFLYAAGSLERRDLVSFEIPGRGTLPLETRALFAQLAERRK